MKFSLKDLIEFTHDAAQEGDQVFVRWSKSIDRDKERGFSLDHSSGSSHAGLSAVKIDDPMTSKGELLLQGVKRTAYSACEYAHDGNDTGWVFIARGCGYDSDGMSLVDAGSIEVFGKLDRQWVDAFREYRADAYDDKVDISDYLDIPA